MRVEIYESPTKANRYLFVPAGTDISNLATSLRTEFDQGKVIKVKDLQPGEKLTAIDVDAALDALSKNGYYLAETQIRFRESEWGPT
ncbi:MAG: YcgL domain-containing protein [Planctomycetota bacterium]|nr:YcgL domain-containing protein [Planctomycetota bacterium]